MQQCVRDQHSVLLNELMTASLNFAEILLFLRNPHPVLRTYYCTHLCV